MPRTRSGKRNYKVGPEHLGRYAAANGTFALGKKRQTIEPRNTRLQTSEASDRQKRIRISDPSPPTPTKEQLVQLPRATRFNTPTCLHYGIDKRGRDIMYPHHFFCNHCEDYVEAMVLSSRKSTIKRNSRAYSCQGKHKSFIHPTTRKLDRTHNSLLQRFRHGHKDVEDDEEQEVRVYVTATRTAAVTNTRTPASTTIARTPHHAANPQGITTVTPASAATPNRRGSPSHDALTDILAEESRRNDELQSKYTNLLTQVEAPKVALRKLQKSYDDLLLRFQTHLAKTQDPMALITRAINLPFNDTGEFDGSDAVVDSDIVKRRKAKKLVANVLMQTKFFDGLVRCEILKQAKRYFKEEVYTPWKILRCMDVNGGKISLESIDLLRTIETDGKKYVSDTILWSSSTIKRVAKLVEEYANRIGLPFSIDRCPENIGSGEVISFEPVPIMKLVLKATALFEEAKKRRITMPQSCDGTQVSKNLGVIIYGIKIADRAAVCPLSKRPVWLHEADGQSAQSLIQSYENCIPLKLIVGKETPALINWALKDNFNLFAKEDKLGDHGGSSRLLGEGFFPLRCPVDADKKMHWAGLGSGGAAKVHKKPCPCCAIESDDLAKPNAELCQRFCQQWQADGKLNDWPNWQCFHKPLITPARIAKI
jgi:hypothetical protein